MKKVMRNSIVLFALIIVSQISFGQNKPFEKINFVIGSWSGEGSGFGNDKSKINSEFKFVMDGKYIEVINDSKFEPTESKPEGEHHIDKGFISYDKIRDKIIFRQFNIEGYINQYVLNDSLSSDNMLVFETEEIENFMPGGKARWTITKINENKIETTFDVKFPNKDYSCFGKNIIERDK